MKRVTNAERRPATGQTSINELASVSASCADREIRGKRRRALLCVDGLKSGEHHRNDPDGHDAECGVVHGSVQRQIEDAETAAVSYHLRSSTPRTTSQPMVTAQPINAMSTIGRKSMLASGG